MFHPSNCPAQLPTATPHCLAGIVLPPLTSDAKARGSSCSESPSSSPEGSGEAEAAAIDAAMDEEATGALNGAHGRSGACREGRGGSRGGAGGSKDVVDAIASGMQRSGMQPGMVRPPAMVTGGWGVGVPVADSLCISGIPLLFCAATHVYQRVISRQTLTCCKPPVQPAEYMAGGSLKSALGRKADIVAGALTRVVLALDAAKGLEYLHSKVRRGGQQGLGID